MAVDSLNALMFGSDDDSVFLAEYTTDLAETVASLGLDDAIPEGFTDCGWLSEDGMTLDLSDSVDQIRGHQGNRVVKEYMSSSDTKFNATLLESKLEIVKWNLDATVKKVTGTDSTAYTEFTAPASRKVKNLIAIVDAHETSGSGDHWRVVFEHVTLGERSGISLKTKEITAYQYSLGVLGGFRLLTNTKAMQATV